MKGIRGEEGKGKQKESWQEKEVWEEEGRKSCPSPLNSTPQSRVSSPGLVGW